MLDIRFDLLRVYFPNVFGCVIQPTGCLAGIAPDRVVLILSGLLLNGACSGVELVGDRFLDCIER
jgi:hypothetical protein